MSSILTGKEFNEKYKNLTFIKLTNQNENHFNFQFKTGENIDIHNFNPTGQCQSGGIYFTDTDNFYHWLNYNSGEMKYYRIVTIPDDALVYDESIEKKKANKLILSERIEIKGSELLINEKVQKVAIRQNGCYIHYINNPSEEVQNLAVQRNGCAIQFIKDPSEELQKMAVQQYAGTIQFINNPSEEVQKLAVQQNGYVKRFF